MAKQEEEFVVRVTADDAILCQPPGQTEQRVELTDLTAVYVEINDSGPWGMDVWWLLDSATETLVAFPLGSTGEKAVLERLQRLPGFEVKGMNSIANARFLCWSVRSD